MMSRPTVPPFQAAAGSSVNMKAALPRTRLVHSNRLFGFSIQVFSFRDCQGPNANWSMTTHLHLKEIARPRPV